MKNKRQESLDNKRQESLEELIGRLGKYCVIEITKMPDSMFVCSIWRRGILVSSGVSSDVYLSVKNAELAIENWLDERTKGRYLVEEEENANNK